MKRFLIILFFALLPVVKAQTLEFSVAYPLSAQVALSGVAISDAVSFGLAVSFERLKVSSNAVLDIAPIGTAQASAQVEWAYVGRFRLLLNARATLGSATLNLGTAFWNAAPANFDAFEVYAADPLPNSTLGSRIDFGLGLRVSRSLSLFTQFKFGSDASSQTVQLRYRSAGLELFGGVLSGSQLADSILLVQSGLTLISEDDALQFHVSGGAGLLNNAFTFEAGLGFSWMYLENLEFELNALYQPWRTDVLPLRGMLEIRFSPGFGVLSLTGFAGLNSSIFFNGGVRLAYRIGFEELFPSSEARVGR
jgi:hypothetical protein